MIFRKTLLKSFQNSSSIRLKDLRIIQTHWRSTSSDLTGRTLNESMKHDIEKKWHNNTGPSTFIQNDKRPKQYILSMFPYPSGSLHMGHVRVYTISDAMARYHRMNGKNVLHPIGWDAFGLPAENAAIQRQIPASVWTKENIGHMTKQLQKLGCSFDWSREIATCDPDYYKWTQHLFLMLHEDGLVYQKEATVNWDPVDKTVLADEQVDANGCSWRSGAKVVKKPLRQWFIRTTKFAESLYAGLDDPTLQDWRDIIKVQKHWIGECNGYSFDLKLNDKSETPVTIWTEHPSHLKSAAFVAVTKGNILNTKKINEGILESKIFNPITQQWLPVVVTSEMEFPLKCDICLGVPVHDETHELIARQNNLQFEKSPVDAADNEEVLAKAKSLNMGGIRVSSKLKDWLVSRQRFWGTPIPMVHCESCGAVPVKAEDLPVKLPETAANEIGLPLSQHESWIKAPCPKCGKTAKRETDTLDTFVDSAWYYLRYIDPHNPNAIFDKEAAHKAMPVDLYVGGKEHAVLHLYYARFINHFLHTRGLVPEPEPFKRLLVQGMVNGKSFRLKGSGQYLTEAEVEITDAKKNQGIEKSTGAPVVVTWEKMSKSKFNGVDPADVINEHGCDTTRLIILGDVAPTSHRNWSSATFPGLINWQKRIWITIYDLQQARDIAEKNFIETPEFLAEEDKMFDARNYYVAGATFNYRFSHQLSVGISKMQGLTNSIRRAPKDVITYGRHYERALIAQILMLAPMAPHFASELWSKLQQTKNRLNVDTNEIDWDKGVFEQPWPVVDKHFMLDFTMKVNGSDRKTVKVQCQHLNKLTHQEALDIAFEQAEVTDYICNRKIKLTNFTLNEGYEATLNIIMEPLAKLVKSDGTMSNSVVV